MHLQGRTAYRAGKTISDGRIVTALLQDIRLLLVEDEFLILADLQAVFEDEGARVITATTVCEGLSAAEGGFDAAVLDVRLPDGEVFPVAERLAARSVPLVFHSGHARTSEIDARFPGALMLSKPAGDWMLIDAVRRQVGGGGT